MADENNQVTTPTTDTGADNVATPTVEELMSELAREKADKERIKNSCFARP